MRLNLYLALGAVAGALSAGAEFIPLGDAPAPTLFGYCFGIDSPRPRCDGIELSFYLFPGLIFGIIFAGAAAWRGRLDMPRGIAFVIVSCVGNAVATALCVGLFVPFSDLLGLDGSRIGLALTGAFSGAIGGGLLSLAAKLVCRARVGRSVAAASVLGLLVFLVPEWQVAGNFVFYVIWQAGYGAALGAGMPQEA